MSRTERWFTRRTHRRIWRQTAGKIPHRTNVFVIYFNDRKRRAAWLRRQEGL